MESEFLSEDFFCSLWVVVVVVVVVVVDVFQFPACVHSHDMMRQVSVPMAVPARVRR